MEINLFHVQVFSSRLENWSVGMLSIVTFKARSIKMKLKMTRIHLIYSYSLEAFWDIIMKKNLLDKSMLYYFNITASAAN